MTEEASTLTEIVHLREQMHFLYMQDNRVSDAVLKTSTILDKHIYAYMRSTAES